MSDRIDPIPTGWAPDAIDRVIQLTERDRQPPDDGGRGGARKRRTGPGRPSGPTVDPDGTVHVDLEA